MVFCRLYFVDYIQWMIFSAIHWILDTVAVSRQLFAQKEFFTIFHYLAMKILQFILRLFASIRLYLNF